MDLLKHLSLGVQPVGKFTEIHYLVYSCPSQDHGDQQKGTSKDVSKLRMLHKLSNDLRKKKFYVTLDYRRGNLWIFTDSATAGVEALPAAIQLVHSDTRRPSDLLNAKTELADHSRPSLEWTDPEIFRHFVQACFERTSFDLAATSLCSPINLRSYLVRLHTLANLQGEQDGDLFSFASLNLEPRISGEVSISFVPEANAQFRSLKVPKERRSVLARFGGKVPVVLVPSGRSAYFQHQPPSSVPTWLRRWRESFVGLLLDRGVSTDPLDSDDSWITVVIPKGDATHGTSAANALAGSDELLIEWPAELCFLRVSVDVTTDGGNKFPVNPGDIQQNPLLDPLDFAIDWLEKAPARLKSSQTRKYAVPPLKYDRSTVEQILSGIDAASPLDGRSSSYLESQHVYPTPSEGISNQVTPAYNDGGSNLPTSEISNSKQAVAGAQIDVDAMETGDASSPAANVTNNHAAKPSEQTKKQETTRPFDIFDLLDSDAVGPDVPEEMQSVKDRAESGSVPELEAHMSPSVEAMATEEFSPADNNGLPMDHDGIAPARSPKQTSEEQLIMDSVSAESQDPIRQAESMKTIAFAPELTVSDHKYSGAGRFSSRGYSSRFGQLKPESVLSPTSLGLRNKAKHSKPISRAGRSTSSLTPDASDGSDVDSADSSLSDAEDAGIRPDHPHVPVTKRRKIVKSAMSPQSGPSPSEANLEGAESFPTPLHQLRSAVNVLLVQTFCTLSSTSLVRPAARKAAIWPIDASRNVELAQFVTEQLSYTKPRQAETLLDTSKPILQILRDLTRPPKDERGHSLNIDMETSEQSSVTASDAFTVEDTDVFRIEPANITLERAGGPWEFASSASAFWETLGLEPSAGEKDVVSYYMYSSTLHLDASIQRFHDTMSDTWSAQRFGTYVAGLLVDDRTDGIIPVSYEIAGRNRQASIVHSFQHASVKLGFWIQDTYHVSQRIIIYIVDSFDAPEALPVICQSFQSLLNSIGAPHVGRHHNVALQTISLATLVDVSRSPYSHPRSAAALAHEVYGRFRPQPGLNPRSWTALHSGASITLAETVQTSVQFQLTDNLSAETLLVPTTLHLAYSVSPEQAWITACWTDSTGSNQHVASYKVTAASSLLDIVSEMFHTSISVMQTRKVKWTLYISKTSHFLPAEEEHWRRLAAQQYMSTPASLYLINVDTTPFPNITMKTSRLTEKPAAPSPAAQSSQPYDMATPIATPKPQTPAASSPGTFPTPATPSASATHDSAGPPLDADSSSRLVDKTDESWGIVLARPLNTSDSPLVYRPALASGYLMKRTGLYDTDVPVLLGASLVLAQDIGAESSRTAAASQEEAVRVLKDVLREFRNLGLLARLRGQEGRESARPWHVAVSLKGSSGLERCMRGVKWVVARNRDAV